MPTTLQLELPASAFLSEPTVFEGFNDPRVTPYLLVANRFDGALDAHTLVRFAGFPDSVSYSSGGTARTEAVRSFQGGRVVARVDSLASAPRARTTLRLWTLDQPFDSATVSWELAQDRPGARVPWRSAGGTRGTLLGEAVWVPGDTVSRDSVVWQVDSLTVQRMARPGFPGLLITVADAGSRLQLGQVALETSVRPAGRPDTTLAQRIDQGAELFVFAPPPPRSASVLRAGGLTGERSVLRLSLSGTVPACARPATTPDCPRVPLREVILNRAELILEPLPVPLGFRPLAPSRALLRRVVEPELGRLAPLGEVLAADTVPVGAFAAPGADPLAVDITAGVRSALGSETSTITLALLAETRVPDFGVLWFDRAPRLRLLYTLPLRPNLP